MDSATESIATAPLPTEKTLRLRANLPYQFYRFLAINLKMVRIILHGHG